MSAVSFPRQFNDSFGGPNIVPHPTMEKADVETGELVSNILVVLGRGFTIAPANV